MLISVVVPCYNEELVIRETHRRLVAVLEQLQPDTFEILYVNDGSRDTTLELLEEIQAGDDRVRLLNFSRNFGHQIAVTAGIDHALGDAVVLIDADLARPTCRDHRNGRALARRLSRGLRNAHRTSW